MLIALQPQTEWPMPSWAFELYLLCQFESMSRRLIAHIFYIIAEALFVYFVVASEYATMEKWLILASAFDFASCHRFVLMRSFAYVPRAAS
jgi:hypothetical protein